MYPYPIKYILDFIVAAFALLILSPILIFVIIWLYISNDGKPFFYQLRPGKNGRIFKIIKFKTMNDRRDGNDHLLPDSDRLTNAGRFIRKTSLDELPQLCNVLMGEMSIVGPRPLLPEYLPLYSEFQKRRHEVRPGITGWAQVNGRNSISWKKKFELDVWYVLNMNLWLDLKILFYTVKKIITREGISAVGHTTMPTFIEFVQNKKKQNG